MAPKLDGARRAFTAAEEKETEEEEEGGQEMVMDRARPPDPISPGQMSRNMPRGDGRTQQAQQLQPTLDASMEAVPPVMLNPPAPNFAQSGDDAQAGAAARLPAGSGGAAQKQARVQQGTATSAGVREWSAMDDIVILAKGLFLSVRMCQRSRSPMLLSNAPAQCVDAEGMGLDWNEAEGVYTVTDGQEFGRLFSKLRDSRKAEVPLSSGPFASMRLHFELVRGKQWATKGSAFQHCQRSGRQHWLWGPRTDVCACGTQMQGRYLALGMCADCYGRWAATNPAVELCQQVERQQRQRWRRGLSKAHGAAGEVEAAEEVVEEEGRGGCGWGQEKEEEGTSASLRMVETEHLCARTGNAYAGSSAGAELVPGWSMRDNDSRERPRSSQDEAGSSVDGASGSSRTCPEPAVHTYGDDAELVEERNEGGELVLQLVERNASHPREDALSPPPSPDREPLCIFPVRDGESDAAGIRSAFSVAAVAENGADMRRKKCNRAVGRTDRRGLSRHTTHSKIATDIFKEWFSANLDYPFPSDEVKAAFADRTGEIDLL